MNSIDVITDKIIADANKYASDLLESSERQAKDIIEQTQKSAEQEASVIKERSKKSDDLELTRSDSSNELALRNALLNEKITISEECFSDAEKKLASLDKDAYIKFLCSYFKDCCENSDAVISLNEKDTAEIGHDFLIAALSVQSNKFPDAVSKLTLSRIPAKIDGGFILTIGDIDYNCSIHSIVSIYKKALEAKVLELLFKA
ncbi:MAG: V-type ATP synthase subunit E family protein [Oscillospiraceae bacterium]|nr:V-type ATP synthase subunit E family protein [Oscillospiraceae bacterium]